MIVLKQILVIVEPGTPAGFQRILLARKFLLDMGAKLLAPCPHEKPCPLISPDWCHFAQRLPRLKSHMRAKEARVPFEDEKFSYLAVARVDLTVTPSASRILAPPQTKKAEIRLRLCGEGRVDEVRVPARDKPAYRAASRKNWGETL